MSSSFGGRDLPVAAGAVAGVAAWILGYLGTYVIAGTRIRESVLGQVLEFVGDGAAVYKLVGWVFYNSHLVGTVFEGVPAGVTNAVGGDGFTPLLFLVAPALLVGAGLAVGRSQGVEAPGDGVVAGLAVVPGYLFLSVVGVVVFVVSAGPASGRPDPLPAVVLAGVLYPAAFGAAGGALAGATEGT